MTRYVICLLLKFYAIVALEISLVWGLYVLLPHIGATVTGAFAACFTLSADIAMMNIFIIFNDPFALWLRTQRS